MNPWEGYMQGQQSLGGSLADLAALQRQRSTDQMAAQQDARAGRLADLQYADLERKSQEDQRKLMEDQQLRETMSQGSTQYVPQQHPRLSLAELGAPQGLQSQPPPWENQPQPTTGPQVGMENKFTRPNPDKVLLDHYAKTDPAKYQGMQKLMMDKFKALSEVDPEGAIGWYNEVSGQNLTYQGKKGDYSIVHTPDGTIVAVNTKNPADAQIIQKGTPKVPDAGAHNITEIPSRDGKTAQKFQYNPQSQRYDIPVGGAYATKSQVPSINVHTSTDAPEDVNAWAKAVKEGRANLADVPNRGTMRSKVVKALEQGGGVDYQANAADNAGFKSSITQQQKQIGAMGSFVKNMDAQIGKVAELSKDLSTFDTRLLNIPLRAVRGRIAGSPQQAKYDMYLAEIESEIGKLATGSASSVAELSVGAQQKWAKIHDKNLSIKDMLSLLQETSAAGKLRMKSVEDQLSETRKKQRTRGGPQTSDPLGIR
jgi:hypothetical protein